VPISVRISSVATLFKLLLSAFIGSSPFALATKVSDNTLDTSFRASSDRSPPRSSIGFITTLLASVTEAAVTPSPP